MNQYYYPDIRSLITLLSHYYCVITTYFTFIILLLQLFTVFEQLKRFKYIAVSI